MQRSERSAAPLPVLGLLVASLALLSSALDAQDSVEATDESGQERHDVREGDTLSQVAERYLGSSEAWPKLWSYNPEITNPHWIYPGYVLRLKEGVELSGQPMASADGTEVTSGVGRSGLRFANRRTPRVGTGVVRLGEEVYLDREALAAAARIAGSSEDHLMLSPSDEAYLKFKDDGHLPAPGKEVTVFLRLHRDEVTAHSARQRTYDSHEGGEIVRVIGAMRIIDHDVERRLARAVVIEALDPIERGFEVADVPRTLPEVPPKPNAQQLEAKVVAATRPLGTLGEGQLVFVDAGGKRGVEVGNRLWVIRQEDPWRKSLPVREALTGAERPELSPLPNSAYPPEVVAELRVIFARAESATALITSSSVEIRPGDRIEMRKGY